MQETKTCETIKPDITYCKMSIKAANEISADANENLQTDLALNKLDRNMVKQVQLKIQIDIDRKRKLHETLVVLKRKRVDYRLSFIFCILYHFIKVLLSMINNLHYFLSCLFTLIGQ